jgi:hypothetical protein
LHTFLVNPIFENLHPQKSTSSMSASQPLTGMDFNLSEEHLAVQAAARDFAQTELLPGVIDRDNAQHFDPALLRKNGRNGVSRHDGGA